MTRGQWARALGLGIFLSALLAAANAYLGLFAGMTVSASIPAAVLSMAVLRKLRASIVENNLVQTAASAGESVAAGAIFTLPALLLTGSWAQFDYLQTALFILTGGVLGVLFTIPLRAPLLTDPTLPYPEGVATAYVLRAGQQEDEGASRQLFRFLFQGALLGGLVKFLQSGLRVLLPSFSKVQMVAGYPLYFGAALSPALMAVGAIVGVNVALVVALGGLINWWLFIPGYADIPSTMLDAAKMSQVWRDHTRYLGVGAMCAAGLQAIFSLRSVIAEVLRKAKSKSVSTRGEVSRDAGAASSEDLPRRLQLLGIAAASTLAFALFVSAGSPLWLALVLSLLLLLLGFLFSAVAAYMAGLVGSSNNPVSGVTIATIMAVALFLLVLKGTSLEHLAVPLSLMVGALICGASAIGGDNMQDLKAAALIGGQPRQSQIFQLAGVAAAALVLPFVLNLLAETYGFGAASEAQPQALAAPQATLMASIAEGVPQTNLPYRIVLTGAALAVFAMIVDALAKARSWRFRVPPLALSVGIYLPLELTLPMLLGALLVWSSGKAQKGQSNSLLFAAGLITGEALMGIVLAFLLSLGVSLAWQGGSSLALSLLVLALISGLLYFSAKRAAS